VTSCQYSSTFKGSMLVTVAVGTTVTIQKETLCVPGNAMDQAITHWHFTVETPGSIPDLSLWDLHEGWNFNSGSYLFTTDTK